MDAERGGDPDVDVPEIGVAHRLPEAGDEQERGDREKESEVPSEEWPRVLDVHRDDGREERRQDERVREPPREEGALDVVDVGDPLLAERDERHTERDRARNSEDRELAPTQRPLGAASRTTQRARR